MSIPAGMLAALGLTKKAKLYLKRYKEVTKESASEGARVALTTQGPLPKLMSAQDAEEVSRVLELERFEMNVQYNPASLSFKGNAGDITTNFLQANINNGVGPQVIYKPCMSMSVELVFDDTNVHDCFNQDDGSIGIGSVVSGISEVASIFGFKHSVRKETEGLLSILNQVETQEVKFCWNDLSFSGIVSEVQAKYTMFSSCGEPVRSTVILNILEPMDKEKDLKQAEKNVKGADLDVMTKMAINTALGAS